MKLEEITPGVSLTGIDGSGIVVVEAVKWFGTEAIEIIYKDQTGRTGNGIYYRDAESSLEIATAGRAWSFDADPNIVKLVSEAYRINLAHMFDPYMAISTSLVTPLPHQITAVYGELLKRQPLRYLLADDPGAGKTIMAGLLIKELIIRGDVKRCLVVTPGSLCEQWQDELEQKFNLYFDILTNDRIAASPSGNPFVDSNLLIVRLDKLSRNEELIEKLEHTDYDLIICDEAHKMSASFFGGEKKETKRYQLGKKLSQVTRHFLLMSATPHNGKDQDFQYFMALLDGDRFEGKLRDGAHVADTSDLMRRMVKEDLLKFDGKPLFPERIAYTVTYELSEMEMALYSAVTEYVRDEFNRAESLEKDGRKGTVGFALTILQRRLASSPYAIFQSLKRRRERLEAMLRESELVARGNAVRIEFSPQTTSVEFESEDDLDELTGEEQENLEEEIVDQATAARTIAELRTEIETLKQLETLAHKVVVARCDKKWEELSRLVQDNEHMFDHTTRKRRKLVIFTEMRDTLEYLCTNLRSLLGRDEAVVLIHGGMAREERLNAQNQFKNLPEVEVLIATDAAGEGINLQRAHLMVNYDLPWNPNRLEQRFGRIHRIGQTEVCHLWNIVAENTREGEVYRTLLNKLEEERRALGGKVFDVLGRAIGGAELRSLMIEALRYGNRDDVRARLDQVVRKLDTGELTRLFEDEALARDSMDSTKVQQIRDEMERAEARKLQPHFISLFFQQAFTHLGGSLKPRENGLYEITHVPAAIRQRDRVIGRRAAVLSKYERICFNKDHYGPGVEFVCPGHPLLDSVIDLVLERYRSTLKQGSIFIDDQTSEPSARVLAYLEHIIQDGKLNENGERRVVSRQFQFVESTEDGCAFNAGSAPYLDYRAPTQQELESILPLLEATWLKENLEQRSIEHAVRTIVPEHLKVVREQRELLLEKTQAAVKLRLTQEIIFWDNRAEELRQQEQSGKTSAKINSQKAFQRAEELRGRLKKRMADLDLEKRISPLPPVAIGGCLVVPELLLRSLRGEDMNQAALFAKETKAVEFAAMKAVIEAEMFLGNTAADVSALKRGWDIESRDAHTGQLRLIEVKGRIETATTVTVTKNEILRALNKGNQFILAIVMVPMGSDNTNINRENIRYVVQPFRREPDIGAASVNYEIKEFWEKGFCPYESARV